MHIMSEKSSYILKLQPQSTFVLEKLHLKPSSYSVSFLYYQEQSMLTKKRERNIIVTDSNVVLKFKCKLIKNFKKISIKLRHIKINDLRRANHLLNAQ